MIEVGDLVRIKNKHLRPGVLSIRSRTRCKPYKHFRGKQIIAKVLAVHDEGYNWRTKQYNRIAILDVIDERWVKLIDKQIQMQIHTSLLTIHRKKNAGRDNRAVRQPS